MLLYLEIIVIVVIVILQLYSFFSTRNRLSQLKNFFPEISKSVSISKCYIPKSVINSSGLSNYIRSIAPEPEETFVDLDVNEGIELLIVDNSFADKHEGFMAVIHSTNAYLSKNKGASADFNILQDTCERYISRIDNSIGNSISVPLYIGLAGTFVGIIVGLWGIDFNGDSGVINAGSINQLLLGVIVAMVASFLGLIMTVINTAITYRTSVYKNDSDKNEYYDFIQRELLPVLNVGMAGSLSSFKGVLNNFISKFGENIGEYHDTAELLNDNLSKQHYVLEEINKLSLTKTSTAIAETFATLKDSSDQFQMFLDYQSSLNQNIEEAQKVVFGLNTTMDKYDKFNSNIEIISQNLNSAVELQRQFKDSLEVHFPTINDHREVWRSQVDEINSDVKVVYKELVEYFKASTRNIQEFVSQNENYFSSQNDTQKAMELIVKTAQIQNEQFTKLNDQMVGVRNDLKDSQMASYELNKDLVDVIKGLTLKLSTLEVSNSNGRS